MSGSERFSFHQTDEIENLYKRRRVQGAPYLLCIFAAGILLMAVGTFITTHALEDHEGESHILIIVGPILLGTGGIFLLCSVIFCIVACYKNSRLQDDFSEDLFNIGSSTFYGGRSFAYLVNEDQSQSFSHQHFANEGILNLAGPPASNNHEDEAVILLANTVAEERNRQRKMSQKVMSRPVLAIAGNPCPCGIVPCNHLQFDDQNAMLTVPRGFSVRGRLDHLGLEKLHRVDPYPELAKDFDLGEGSLLSVRDRSASVYNRQHSTASADADPHRLRRNVTYTASSRSRIAAKIHQDILKQKQLGQQDPITTPQWRRFGSLQRKPKEKKDLGAQDGIRIHQLPKYDPDLLSALGITPPTGDSPDADYNGDPALQPGLPPVANQGNQSPQMASGSRPGSLRRPVHRKPSMGVRSLKVQQASSSTSRLKTSAYASDMSLHRSGSEGMVTQHHTIPEDDYLRQQENFASQVAHPICMSSSFTQGFTSEVDSNSRMKTTRVWSLSSSPSPPASPGRPLRRAESHNSSLPKSSISSNCSCRSERCSNTSCSDCEMREESQKTKRPGEE
ncbi:uncharacterized protein [Palaemon carinicauda]|uniref:uncharacterized protein n=1 Tax=Palaemon carinicauda TaxID=392227 RepID=UPI0035B692BB